MLRVQYRFEHSALVHAFIVKHGDKDALKQQLASQTQSLGSPLKRVREIISGKVKNASDPFVSALYNPRVRDGYVLRNGPVKYTPLPEISYTEVDAQLLTTRKHLDQASIAVVPGN
jgi:hypothetical protein